MTANANQLPDQGHQKINELESLRGLAALLVAAYHIPLWHQSFNFEIIRNAYLMVDLFFVLSGFVIFNAYVNKIGNGRQLLHFQFLRFGRLYPVHFLFLLINFFIELAKYFAQEKFGIVSTNSRPFRENNLEALAQQVFLLQAIGPTDNTTTFNQPAWSISVEFYTYFIFGLAVLFGKKSKQYVFVTIFAISFFLMINESFFGFKDLLRCTCGFFLGCIAANIRQITTLKTPSFLSAVIFVLIIIFLIFKVRHELDFFIYPLAATLIFSLTTSGSGLLKSILNLKVLTWLGTISYSIYLSHFTVEWIANQIVRVIMKKPEIIIDGKSIPQLSFAETAVAYILICFFVLLISHLIYTLVEKPCREKFRRVVF